MPATANTWTDINPAAATTRYLAHTTSLRGAARHAVVARQLARHLPKPPARILDVGGGSGTHAIQLARQGHQVVLLDPAEEMLANARAALSTEPAEVRQRIQLIRGPGEHAPTLLAGQHFDIVVCHGVLLYLDDPNPMLDALVAMTRPDGGLLSILTKNADALAMRPALEGRYPDALAALNDDQETNRLGLATRSDTPDQLSAALRQRGTHQVCWYGVRCFTDHLGDTPPDDQLPAIIDLELAAGDRDPYRQIARLFHLLARTSTT